jgi:putative hydrolase of the HAD superfamily
MNLRAVIFDVYGTLLRVGPPPADADARWQRLFHDAFGRAPHLTRLNFTVACQKVIVARHETARARGIPFPEILWPEIVAEVLPEFARLETAAQEDFLLRQIQTGHTTELFPEAAPALRELARRGTVLGIASNSQRYTLRELRDALKAHGLDLDLFERDLCFWSFEHGFSKPDPHVFRILTVRLEARGIRPAESLMVGDRPDHDLEPARAFGWQTWQLVAAKQNDRSGSWRELLAWLS